MKIEIDTHLEEPNAHKRRMRLKIDGREFVVEREGHVITLRPNPGDNSLGALVACSLYSAIDDLRKAEETLHGVNVFDTWAEIPDDLAEEIEGCL